MFFVSRRRYAADLAAGKAEANRQRERAEKAVANLATAMFNRDQILRQNADLDAANRRLHGRNLELGRRITQLAEADPEYAAALEARVSRLRRVGRRVLAAYAAENRRAQRLQAELDDACGLNHPAIEEGRNWQARRTDKPTVKEPTS